MKFVKIPDPALNFIASAPFELNSINLFSKYYQEYYQEKFTDLTFVVMQDDRIVGYVLCSVLDGKLSLPDGGIIINLFNDHSKEIKKRYVGILEHLYFLAKQYSCISITIKDCLMNGSLSGLGQQLFNRKFQSRLTFEMGREYKNFGVDNFYATLRKSYKSLINWGKKNLEIQNINKNFLCSNHFNQFQDFHAKIAGRKTRSDTSWQTQYEMIKEGFGELILAWYNNVLVAGSLFADYGDTSIYFTGVYERELFDFGLSHFLLYSGICRSYERGNTSKFSLGYFDTDITDPKWYNIQFYKKGFSEELQPIIFWSQEII